MHSQEASDAIRYWAASLRRDIENLPKKSHTFGPHICLRYADVIAALDRHAPPAPTQSAVENSHIAGSDEGGSQ